MAVPFLNWLAATGETSEPAAEWPDQASSMDAFGADDGRVPRGFGFPDAALLAGSSARARFDVPGFPEDTCS